MNEKNKNLEKYTEGAGEEFNMFTLALKLCTGPLAKKIYSGEFDGERIARITSGDVTIADFGYLVSVLEKEDNEERPTEFYIT